MKLANQPPADKITAPDRRRLCRVYAGDRERLIRELMAHAEAMVPTLDEAARAELRDRAIEFWLEIVPAPSLPAGVAATARGQMILAPPRLARGPP